MSDLISRSDAIGAVKEERFPIDSDYAEGFMAALDKVEWILKEWLPSAQPDSKELSGTHKALDTISRQAAIDALTSHIMPHNNEDGTVTIGVLSKSSIKNILNKLPSAQPETHEERTETHACDCISRQAAIDALDCISGVEEVLRSLPSAQSEPIRINLNEPIKVKLTDWGKEIYYHQYDRTNQIAGREICKPMFPREDENGYTEFQLWCFIELYGMHMGMTLPNVIEPLEIVYER